MQCPFYPLRNLEHCVHGVLQGQFSQMLAASAYAPPPTPRLAGLRREAGGGIGEGGGESYEVEVGRAGLQGRVG
jgi:hypothetical protein